VTPRELIGKWRSVELKERSAAPEHFLDLCALVGPLYNERPAWLANAHRALDEAVFAAYGWPPDLGDEQILERLLAPTWARTPSRWSSFSLSWSWMRFVVCAYNEPGSSARWNVGCNPLTAGRCTNRRREKIACASNQHIRMSTS
jgi:hypothetical protein